MKPISITNIGAGSLYTPDFALMLIEKRDQLLVGEWRMMDPDAERLKAVVDFTQRILDDASMGIKISSTTELVGAVKDADYVFSTIRVGGARSRILDESIPLKYGLIGQETTAPGGMAMGLRTIPEIVKIAQAVVDHANAGAWLINLSNPSGMLTEAIYRYTHCRAVGLCNWPRSFWTRMMEAYNVERNDVFLELAGLNHLFWAKAYVKGKGVNDEAARKFKEVFSEKYGEELVNAKFAMPQEVTDLNEDWSLAVPYLRHYYLTEETLEEQNSDVDYKSQKMVENMRGDIPGEILDKIDFSKIKTRADFVERVDEITQDLYSELNSDGLKLVQGTRGGEGYGAAGLDIVLAIENNLNEVQAVDFPNLGSIPDFPREIVMEHSCLINAAGIYPLSMPALKPHMHALVNAVKQYEILTCEAAMEGDYRKALEALVANPLIRNFYKAKACLDELLIGHKAYLPNFGDAIRKIEAGIQPY